MSSSSRPKHHTEDPSRYAPKWIREARLRTIESGGRLPRASQLDSGDVPLDEPEMRSPRLADLDEYPGAAPPPWRQDAGFEGDTALKQMREAHAFEPDVVPEPQWRARRKFPFGVLVRAAGAIAVATCGALVYVSMMPGSVPSALQGMMPSLANKPAVGTGRATVPERPVKMSSRLGDDQAPAGAPTMTAPAPTASAAPPVADNVRAVKTVTLSPWPVAAPPSPAATAPVAPPPSPATAPPAAATAPASPTVAPPVAAPRAPAAAPAPPPVTRHVDADEIEALIQRGEAFILQGDFVAARLMLRRATEAGNARAAVMLGATYDPVMLRKVGVVGFQPEPELARQWYERALALGSPEASARLAELGRN